MKDNELRDALLRLEEFNPNLRKKYQEELKNIVEKRLKPWERKAWCLWALLGFVFMIVFGAIALLAGPDLPWQGRIGFGFGSLFGAMWIVLCLLIVKKGSFHLKRDNLILGATTWVFLVVISAIFLILGSQMRNTTQGVLVIVFNLTFLVMFGLILTWRRVSHTERSLRENLLRLELLLFELVEYVAGDKNEGTRYRKKG